MMIEGKDVAEKFKNESGVHRYQRIPPTEKQGRIQTSTITVAILDIPESKLSTINEDDIDFRTTCSSGNGGQNVQRNATAVIATHIPTGIQVRCENERSQYQNKLFAVDMISAKIAQIEKEKYHDNRNNNRKSQIGNGSRGSEKIRTIRYQDNTVRDEKTGKQKLLKNYLKGDIKF